MTTNEPPLTADEKQPVPFENELSRFLINGDYFPSVCEECGYMTSSEHIGCAYSHDESQTYCIKCSNEGKPHTDPEEAELSEYISGIVEAATQQIASLQAQLDTASAQLAMVQWQPIETAPKDRTLILYDPKYIGFLQTQAKPHTGYYQSNFKDNRWETTGNHIAINPTHWMSLPLPPDQTQTAALQAKLDEANAQLAMLVDTLQKSNRWVMPPDNTGIDEVDAKRQKEYQQWAEAYHTAIDQTQPATAQWLFDRDAELLKPWREAVATLRGSLTDAIDSITTEYCSHGFVQGCGPNTETCYAKEHYKALKATEGLTE